MMRREIPAAGESGVDGPKIDNEELEAGSGRRVINGGDPGVGSLSDIVPSLSTQPPFHPPLTPTDEAS